MNKKGFTLVELLGVIAIIAILSVMAVPAVLTISRNSKENMFCKKVQTIERAAQLYAEDNMNLLDNDDALIETANTKCNITEYDFSNNTEKGTQTREDCETVSVKTLASKNYLNYESNKNGVQNNIFDPRDYKSMLNNTVMIYISNKRVHAQYVYKNKKDAQRCMSFIKFQGNKKRSLYYRCDNKIRLVEEINTATKEDRKKCTEPTIEEDDGESASLPPDDSDQIFIDYDEDGGSKCNPLTKEVKLGENYGTLCETSKEGYTFDGWELEDEKEVNEYAEDGSILSSRIETIATTITPTTKVTRAEDHTLIASWTKIIKKVNVTYDSNGGTPCSPNKKEVIVDENYGELCSGITKDNYNFAGWYLGARKIESTSIVTNTTDHTLVAKWNPEATIAEPIKLENYPDGVWLVNLDNTDLALANKTSNPPKNVYIKGAKPTLMQASQCKYVANYEYGSQYIWQKEHYCVKKPLMNEIQLRFVDSSGSDITKYLSNWVSSDTNVVTVSSTGLVQRVGAGIATVTASLPNGHTHSEKIYVANAAFMETAWPVSEKANPYKINGYYYIFGSNTNVVGNPKYSRDLNYLVLESVPLGTCNGTSYYYNKTGNICSCAKILATSYGADRIEGHKQKDLVGKYTEIDPYYKYQVYWYYFNIVTRYKESGSGSCQSAKSITKVLYRPDDPKENFIIRDP